MALSGNRNTKSKKIVGKQSYPVAAGVRIYAGSLVMLNSGGFALPAAALAGNLHCVGVARREANNTGGADGAISITVDEGVFDLAATSIAQGNTNGIMYAQDDQTVDETQGSNQPIAGVLKEFVSSTEGWVEVIAAQNKALAT